MKLIIDYEFVSFKLTNFSDVDWYIDSFGNVIKIYKKSFIKKQLSKYSSFKEVWSIFDIVMEWN